jgi:hypothetical protein
VPYWTPKEEKTLIEMLPNVGSLEDLARALNRSPEAIAMKLKRMKLAIPEKHSAISERNKVTVSATTTTTSEPIKPAEDLISIEEALKLMLSGLQRLLDPNVGPGEVKRIRLLITGLKGYVVIVQNYYVRMRQIEKGLVAMMRRQIVDFQVSMEREEDEAEKKLWRERIREIEADVKDFEEAGASKPFAGGLARGD